MVDKIEMSLDEIIKKTRASKRGRGGRRNPPRGNNFRGPARTGRGVQRGRNRGGISRPQSLPFTKVSLISHQLHMEAFP